MLSDCDRSLIGALQVSPRAPWSDLGEALDISGVTAARRWRRLSDEGKAWVTASPGMFYRAEQCFAYVEIDCAPGKRTEVANRLAQQEMVVTVEITTGNADILLTIGAADLSMLSGYLLDQLGVMENVLRTRARVATKIYSEGSSWRLVNFDEAKLSVLERSRPEAVRTSGEENPLVMTSDLRYIARLLTVNGRASYTELAEAANMSQTTVRRHVNWLLRAGVLLPRTDLAAELSGYPVQVYLWADAPVDGLPAAAAQLTRMHQVRLCATVSSAPSLVVCAWLRSVEDVHRFELSISKRLPQVRIVDRFVVLRTVKRMGRLVNPQGRAIGVVPMNVWDIGVAVTTHT